jgi:hypothetical protein
MTRTNAVNDVRPELVVYSSFSLLIICRKRSLVFTFLGKNRKKHYFASKKATDCFKLDLQIAGGKEIRL